MKTTPLATYHDVYQYFELYEDYIQIHQSSGTIPYPAILKKDGEKFYFDDLKKVIISRELGHVEEEGLDYEELEEIIPEMTYVFKLKFKRKTIILKSKVSYSGWGIKHQPEEFRKFVLPLISIIEKKEKIKVQGLTGYYARSYRIRRKLAKIIAAAGIGGTVIIEATTGIFYDYFVYEFGLPALFTVLGIISLITVSTFVTFDRLMKKKLTWDEVLKEYIPSELRSENKETNQLKNSISDE